MRVKLTTTAVVAALVLATAGCGEDASSPPPSQPAAAPAAASASAAADPAREWRNAVSDLCTTLAGKVSGQQMRDSVDGKFSPDEVLAGEKAARPHVEAFDKGLASLTVPPEAAAADKALKDFLAMSKKSAAPLLAAAQAGDQAALQKAFARREAERLGPKGVDSLEAVGLPEKCFYRGSYS